ncbi:MAG: TPMT family class I SAM-dependent methyltransferase [Demequina sp.]|nr:TPMT family class I SAM-dependent methyltransferase [Demequina sp.]
MREQDPAEHWEQRYRENTRAWSGSANPTLVSVISGLTPGTALDLACGEGADAAWLASQGWNVTGVDISPTAIQRARGRGWRGWGDVRGRGPLPVGARRAG